MTTKYFKKYFNSQIPTAWDYYFLKKETCIVRVNMIDGTETIGYYGTQSYATSYPNDGSIYLQEQYHIVNDTLSVVPKSKGILIRRDTYISIELYEPPKIQKDENE